MPDTIEAMSLGASNTGPVVTDPPVVQQTAATTANAGDSVSNTAPQTNTFDAAKSFKDLSTQANAGSMPEFATYDSSKSADTVKKPQAALDYMTPESTVAYQLSKVLDPNSQINRTVTANAREQSAAMGMGRSTAALEIAQKALIDRGLQIAQPDAETAAKFSLQQQQADNTQLQTLAEAQVAGDLNVQKARIAEQTARTQRQWEAAMTGLSEEAKIDLTNLTKSWDDKITKYQLEVQERMKNAELDANAEVMLMNQSNEMMNNYQVTVQQLMSNTEFMNSLTDPTTNVVDRTKMARIFDAMFGTVSSALQFSANAVGVGATMSPYIQQLIQQNAWTSAEAGG